MERSTQVATEHIIETLFVETTLTESCSSET